MKQTKKQYKKDNKTYHKRQKKMRRSKTFKKLNCAPDPERKHGFTCFNTEKLHMIRDAWNARHPDAFIKESDPKEIWYKLKEYMADTCQNELCWLKQQFIKTSLDSSLFHHTFAPTSPKTWEKNPYEWLSSINILSVMAQYEEKYKCFDFMGPSPINYDTHINDGECVWKEICELKISEVLSKGKNKVGFIFNLDPHYKTGSHWVALFVNIKKHEIYYFNSNGFPPPKQIKKLMEEIQRQGKELGIDFKMDHTNLQHQYSTSECGMYCLYFIIQMLNDMPFSYFQTKRIPDNQMKQIRKLYFN